MLYYLLWIPAVLSTAWIYFLSPALSYWWLLPVFNRLLRGSEPRVRAADVCLHVVCRPGNKMYAHISPFYHALTMALDGWILALCRVKIHVEGLEKVPTDTEYLFVSNHRSNFDPMVQWWVLRRWRLAFVSKPSNMRKFVIGPFVRRCCFFADRPRKRARNALTTINAAADLIRAHECSFAIYPEGTRSKAVSCCPGTPARSKSHRRQASPIVVATIEGTEAHRAQCPLAATHCMCASARSSGRDRQGRENDRPHRRHPEQNARRAGQITLKKSSIFLVRTFAGEDF